MQQRDYLERMIAQIAEAIGRALGLCKQGQVEEAEEAVMNAWRTLGLRKADMMRVDDATLRVLVGAKLELVVALFEAHAAIEDARGNSALAEAFRKRAAALTS